MKYRTDIDGLRAFAIIPVVLFHAGLGMTGGFVGVDVFFVISGFLLSSIVIQEMQEKSFSFLAFYERRFRRLVPAFIVMLVACFAAFALVMLPEDFAEFAHSALGSIFFYANFHFYGSIDYFSQSAALMPLLHMWSLAIEEQFYAFLPLSMMVMLLIFPRHWLAALITLVLLGSFALCIYYTYAYRPFAFYMPHTRAWELLAGTLLAALPRMSGSVRLANWLGSSALLTLVVIIFTYDERDAFPGWLAALPVLATAVLIYCGAAAPTCLPSRMLSARPLVFIGKISYSLYLWHWPVIVFVTYTDLAQESLATRIGCVVVSVALATISWALVEQPVRRRKVFSTFPKVYAGTAISAAMMGLVAFAIIRFDGLPNRVPDDLQVLLDSDRYATENAECMFLKEAATAVPCHRGAPDVAPSFFLIGDSHAFALSPGLFAAAKEQNVAGLQYTAPGFFPGLGMRGIGARVENPRSNRMLEIIDAHPDIRTIVFSAAWADYALGSNWKGQSWLYQDDISVAERTADNVEIFARALDRIVVALPDHDILLLDDVPAGIELDLNFFVRRAMLRPLDRAEAVLPRAEVEQRRLSYVPILREIATRYDHVHFVPVFENFCMAPSGCSLFSEDLSTPLYRDGDHLSNTGALALTDRFRDIVLLPMIALRAQSADGEVFLMQGVDGTHRATDILQ